MLSAERCTLIFQRSIESSGLGREFCDFIVFYSPLQDKFVCPAMGLLETKRRPTARDTLAGRAAVHRG
jgi:hypothetical protein